MSKNNFNNGSDTVRIAVFLRAALEDGTFSVGQFLPTTRELGRQWHVSPETVRRAMQELQREGLLEIVPRHGCKAINKPIDVSQKIFVHVHSQSSSDREFWIEQHLSTIFQQVVAKQGGMLITIGGEYTDNLTAYIESLGAKGILLNDSSPAVVKAVLDTGLPIIVIEDWDVTGRFDAVCQDNFRGAMQAIEYLKRRGHKRVAWIGSTSASQTAIERWGGVLAGVRQYGMELPDDLVFEQISEESLQNLVSSLLFKENPPTAIVALWGRYAAAVARVTRAAGLQPGDDFDLVGWTNTEFKDEYIQFFQGEPMPAVAWSIRSMAEIAIARLVERSQNPDMPTVRINIATKIIFDETQCVSSVLKTQIVK